MLNKPLLHLDFYLFQLSVRGSNPNLQVGVSGGTLVPAGPSVSPKHKVDNRYQGGDSDGPIIPGRAMPAASQAPATEHLQQSQPAALCKALFDFNPTEMNLEDSESFLSFQKVWIAISILTDSLTLAFFKLTFLFILFY